MKLVKILASLLALSTIGMSDSYATLIQVPAGFPTISSAISASNPGDTIVVGAGVYNEHVVINVAGLTLLGAQANVDARTRTYTPANESIITFATPAFGTGIVNIAAPDVTLNGFTVQGNGTTVNSTAAIFAGDAGTFLPSSTTIDVTGLQLLNNIVQNNANGILIASIEPTPKTPNYLVKYNYFQNNSGSSATGNGQGVFFNNSAGSVMTNVTVTENLFNGMETSASVSLTNVTTATVSYNVMNQDNSIALFATAGASIIGNATSGATGTSSNTASAIFVGLGNSNTTIADNRIYTATSNGISIFQGNSNITITDNCIVGNTLAGISLSDVVVANSNIAINNNNIEMNTTGLSLDPGSYTSPPPLLDATSNYWNSALGPNYNGTSPGAGDLVTDDNVSATQTVRDTPFLTKAIVCPSPVAITLSPSTLPSASVAATYNQTISAGGGTSPYSYAVTSGALPAGMTLSLSGVLSGTPTAGGSFNFTVTASDSSTATGPYTGSQSYTLLVNSPTIILSPSSLPAATFAIAYNESISASGGTGPYSYAVTSGALPAGMMLSLSGVLSGTPTVGGSFNFTVTATDSSTGAGPYAGSQAYTLQVDPPTIVLSPSTLPAATVAAAYTQTISASGGTSPYSYAVTFGALPAGMTLSLSGVLSGVPTAGGSFGFTVTASDSSTANGPYTGSQSYTLLVNSPTIILSPSSLPAATFATAYNESISASGGTGPYGYALTSGALPAGMTLSLSGALSGTPTAGGSFNFTVTASDSSTGAGPYAGSQAYTLQVDPGTQALSVTAPTSIVVNQGLTTVTVTASSGLQVTLTSATPTVCSASGTGPSFTVTLLGTGTCTLSASQAGDANFAPISTAVTVLVLAAAEQTSEPAPMLDNKLLIALGLLFGLIGFMRLRRA